MKATVIFDGDCGFCQRARDAAGWLDWFHALDWKPLQDPAVERFGIARVELECRMYFVSGERHSGGFAAVKAVLLRLPALYLVAAAACLLTPWSLLAFVVLFSPVFTPLGNRLYDWIARNRYRLPGSTCKRSI